MKKRFVKLLVAIALVALTGSSAYARSWRINSDATKKPHFTDINAAMSSSEVVAGDTLYLDPGTTITSTQNVTKQVTIIGTGYLLGGQPFEEAKVIGGINLKAAGTKLEGVRLARLDDSQRTLSIQAANVIVERCRYDHISVESQNATIRQCSGYRIYGKGSTNTTSANCTIENCLIATSGTVCVFDLYSPTIRNNYIYNKGTIYTFSNISSGVIINNLILRSNSNALNNFFQNISTNTITNNVMSCAESVYGSTYPDNVYLGALPEGAYYQHVPTDAVMTDTDREAPLLKELTVLRGAATDGGDCGPFGGMYPYVCSGYPLGMPHFESSTVPTRPQDGQLRVTQKVVLQSE